MNSLWRYVGVEWKLLFRGPMFWISCAIGGGVFLLFSSEDHYRPNIGKFAMVQSMYLMVVFLFGLLMAMHAARREYVTKNDLLLGSLPAKYWQVQTAKIMGLALPLSVIALVPMAIFAIRSSRAGIPIREAGDGILIFASSLVPLWFAVVAGYIIGSLSRKRWIYMAGIAIFLIATYAVQLLLLPRFHSVWAFLFDFTQLDLFRPELYSEVWGFTHDNVFWLHRTIYASAAVAAFLFYLLIGMRRRREKGGSAALYGLAAVATAVLLAAVGAYFQATISRMDGIEAEKRFYRASYENTGYDLSGKRIVPAGEKLEMEEASRYEGLKAESYDLTLHPGKGHRLSAEAKLSLVNGTGGELKRFPITLKHIFEIESIVVNGEEAMYEWEPERDYLWVSPASPLPDRGAVSMEMTYEGKVDEWRHEPNDNAGVYRRQAFVDKDGLYLPGRAGWYPAPGIRRLVRYEEIHYMAMNGSSSVAAWLTDANSALPSANYRASVVTEGPLEVLTVSGQTARTERKDGRYRTEIRSEGATGLTLLAAPMRKFEQEGEEHSYAFVADRFESEEEAAEALKSFGALTDRTLSLIRELWPDTADDLSSLPKQWTFMKSEGINRIPRAEGLEMWINADGIVSLPKYFDPLRYAPNIEYAWAEKLLEAFVDRDGHASPDFLDMLSAYLARDPSKSGESAEIPLFDESDAAVHTEFRDVFNRIYRQSSELQFRGFIREYYDFIAVHDKDGLTQVRELEYLRAKAGERS